MLSCAERDRAREIPSDLLVGHHESSCAVGYKRTIRPAERMGYIRILVGRRVAEFEIEILAHVRVRIAHTIFVVFCRDHRELFAPIAIALEITLRDRPKTPANPPSTSLSSGR